MKRRLNHIIALAALAGCLSLKGPAAAGVDFLIPGVSLESLAFDPGARVAYIVIGEAYGTSDSTLVELAVIDRSDSLVTIEISSSPYPASVEETVTVRLVLDEQVRSIDSPDAFYGYVREVHVKEGRDPFREPTAEEIGDYDLEEVFIKKRDDAERTTLDDREIITPAGAFTCRVHELSKSIVRPVNLGGVEAEMREEERSVLYLSDAVPFWGLVRSRVESRRSTRILGGMREQGGAPRTVVTESILYSYHAADDGGE
jgi:hypothetical protein